MDIDSKSVRYAGANFMLLFIYKESPCTRITRKRQQLPLTGISGSTRLPDVDDSK